MTYYRKIKQIALPVVGEQLLQMSMGAVDNYFLAYLGIVVLSGVSVASNIIIIYQSVFLALGAAISSYVSSRKNNGSKVEWLSEVIGLTLLIGLVFGLVSILLSNQLLLRLGTAADVAIYGGQYLQIVGGSVVLVGLISSLGAFLRAEGEYDSPVKISFVANFINIVLSGLSIYVWHLGLLGVAISTVFSRLVAVFLLLNKVKTSPIQFRWVFNPKSDLLNLALPATFERLMMRCGDLVMVMLLTLFGTKALAGNAIGETITQFNYMFGFAVSTAVVILTAEVKDDRAERTKVLRESYIVMLMGMLLMALTVFISRGRLIELFTTDARASSIAEIVILFSLFSLPATAGTLTLTAYSQGLGNSKFPFYATTFGMWVIRLLGGYLVAVIFNVGVWGLYLTTMLDNLFRTIYLYYTTSKK